MIGTQSDPGIMVRVMEDLFLHSQIQGKAQGEQFKVTVSFLEVYNENIRDLLSDVEEYLDLREDPIKGPVVASITEIETVSSQEIMQLLLQGNAKRSQAATAANEVSSRSHAVLQVVVESRDRAPGTVANIKVGKLSLVDLAGSERAANTKNSGQRLVEGANINRSLLALGNCINALGEKGNKGNFVPYRDSKLTRLLKDSLGGNCRTVMIANISSAESSFEETLNTLKYANRAKNIKTNVQRNVLNVNYHISEYVELINNLRSEIQVLKNQIGGGSAIDRVATSHLARDLVSAGHNQMRLLSPGPAGSVISSGYPQQSMNSPAVHAPPPGLQGPSTPFQALRESLRSGAGGEGRELVNNMRQRIVDNFQERMQLRRSLIELEDQNVQNGIEVSKRQLIIVQWSEKHGNLIKKFTGVDGLTKADFAAYINSNGEPEIIEAWQECEQLRKAIIKNNGMKKNIAKRLRHNEKEAEKFRDELGDNVTGEDRRELMALQYQVGRLELENMELEQHRIVHESILKGKDLVIQKLKLQLAVRDKVINRQQSILKEHELDHKVGYDQLALLEETLMGDAEYNSAPPSPPRNVNDILMEPSVGIKESISSNSLESLTNHSNAGKPTKKIRHEDRPKVPKLKIQSKPSVIDEDVNEIDDDYEMPITERALTSRDRDIIEQGDWSEIKSELSDQNFVLTSSNGERKNRRVRMDKYTSFPSQQQLQQLQQPPAPQPGGGLNSGRDNNNNNSNKVNGPRGGRMYRTPANNNNNYNTSTSTSNNVVEAKISARGSGFNNDDFFIEEDPSNNSLTNKYRQYVSPRAIAAVLPKKDRDSIDRLESIPSQAKDTDEGILSGRRYDRDSYPSLNNISPRNSIDGYMPIYPALGSMKSQRDSKSERDLGGLVPIIRVGGMSHDTNYTNSARKSLEDDVLLPHGSGSEEKILSSRKYPTRASSKGALDEVNSAADLLFSDFSTSDGNVNNNNANAPVVGGGDGHDLVVKARPLVGKPTTKMRPIVSKVEALSKIVESNPLSSMSNPPTNDFAGDLNVLGNGIDGFSAAGGQGNNRLQQQQPVGGRSKLSIR